MNYSYTNFTDVVATMESYVKSGDILLGEYAPRNYTKYDRYGPVCKLRMTQRRK